MKTYFMLISGFFLLIKGADFFVTGSASIAKKFRIPSIVIGLTIVALGTSLPEASVSITAALTGRNELSVSNVIGSNIFNLMIVIGASAILHPIGMKQSILKRDFPVSIWSAALLMVMYLPVVQQNHKITSLSRIEGFILLLLCVLYLLWMIKTPWPFGGRAGSTPMSRNYPHLRRLSFTWSWALAASSSAENGS